MRQPEPQQVHRRRGAHRYKFQPDDAGAREPAVSAHGQLGAPLRQPIQQVLLVGHQDGAVHRLQAAQIEGYAGAKRSEQALKILLLGSSRTRSASPS
jgi:hypothetical protein